MAKIPPIELTAGVTGRTFNLGQLGRHALLVFLWQDTMDLGEVINREVRSRYPQPSQILIMNVADLRGVPRIFRGLVESEMRRVFKENVAKLPKGVDPGEYLVLIPDWKGETVKALGLQDIRDAPAVALLDGEGNILGSYQGKGLAEATLELLARNNLPTE